LKEGVGKTDLRLPKHFIDGRGWPPWRGVVRYVCSVWRKQIRGGDSRPRLGEMVIIIGTVKVFEEGAGQRITKAANRALKREKGARGEGPLFMFILKENQNLGDEGGKRHNTFFLGWRKGNERDDRDRRTRHQNGPSKNHPQLLGREARSTSSNMENRHISPNQKKGGKNDPPKLRKIALLKKNVVGWGRTNGNLTEIKKGGPPLKVLL